MSCLLTDSSVVVKEGKVWVIDGKYRVKKLSECQIVGGEKEDSAPEVVVEQPQAAVISAPPPAPVVPQATVGVPTHTTPSENQEFIELFKLVGGNAWLALVVVVYVLGKKYLEKMDLAQASQAKLKEEISKQASETNTKIEGVSSKLDSVVSVKIEQNKTEVLGQIRDTKTEISKELDVLRRDSAKEIDSLKKESKVLVDSLEKRVLGLEMEVKYLSGNKGTPSGRGKKTTSNEED
jgi:hypothetical protein